MVHTRNTAARAGGEDHVDVQIAEGTVPMEEIALQEAVAVSQTTEKEAATEEVMSIAELQKMVQELYNTHAKSSKVMDPTSVAQKCCMGQGAGPSEAGPLNALSTDVVVGETVRRRLAMRTGQ